MKLVFYSGGDESENNNLDELTVNLTGQTKPRMAFIPACSYQSDIEFYGFVNQFRKFDITQFIHFPIDVPFDSIMLEEVFNCDVIHLGGGNTYYFLKYIRQNKLMPRLRQFVQKGGVLTGLSAGGILMTPSIETAGFPDFDRDVNDENLTNLKSLGLVKFEFFPHYRNSTRYDLELMKYSKKIDYPLYACPDGSGIVIENKTTIFHGRSFCFYKGRKFLINSRLSALKAA